VWLSVDPMADKYPSMSPFMYCAGNPLKYVDPDGREIWLIGSEAKNEFYGLLTSFSGVNQNNMYKAFGANLRVDDDNNKISGTLMSKKTFKEHFEKITDRPIKGKELSNAYALHKAMASIDIVEIATLTGSKGSETKKPTDIKGTDFKDDDSLIPSSNENTKRFFNNCKSIYKLDEEFNNMSDIVAKGKNWVRVNFSPSTPNHKGTIIINGNTAKTSSEKKQAIMDSLKNLP